MIIIGIDPGAQGFIVKCRNKRIIDSSPIPYDSGEVDVLKFARILDDFSSGVSGIVIEEQSTFGGREGSRSIFTTGKNYGILKAVATVMLFPVAIVPPKAWQKTTGVTKLRRSYSKEFKKKNMDLKQIAIQRAVEIAVGEDFRKSNRAKKNHSGKCEAYLMAQHGMTLDWKLTPEQVEDRRERSFP